MSDKSQEELAEEIITQQNRKYHPISIDEFIRFLEVVTGDASCQACGNPQFSAVSAPGQPELAGFVTTPVRSTGDRGNQIPTVAVVCMKCGWVRSHATIAVRRWLADNPSEEAEDTSGDKSE